MKRILFMLLSFLAAIIGMLMMLSAALLGFDLLRGSDEENKK